MTARVFVLHQNPNLECQPDHLSYRRSTTHRVRTRSKDFLWIVEKSVITGAPGVPPGKGQHKTAYRDIDLAGFSGTVLRGNPATKRKQLVSIFKSVLRYPELITSAQFFRVRRIASVEAFGRPVDNVSFTPEIRKSMDKLGHELEYSTVSASRSGQLSFPALAMNTTNSKRRPFLFLRKSAPMKRLKPPGFGWTPAMVCSRLKQLGWSGILI